jgi:hypothetical protein
MKLSTAAVFGLLTLPSASAFAPTMSSRSPTGLRMSDFRATDQLSLANQQRAAAIRAAEARNQAEIEALKLQIAQIESSLYNTSPGGLGYAAAGLPSDFSSMNRNQLQNKLSEFKNYLGTLLRRSEDNQRQFNAVTGGAGGALGTAVLAGATGAVLTNALDSNRRDSIGGILAGAAGSIASSLSGPATSSKPTLSTNDPRAQVRQCQERILPLTLKKGYFISLFFPTCSLFWRECSKHFLEPSQMLIWSIK